MKIENEEEEENQDEENEEDIIEEKENNSIRKNIQEENINEKINYEEEEKEEEKEEENKQEKGGSIIPEDNDIFGTKNYGNQNKNIRKPRKIQEDGIPVIKRVEERDNVKDIMINNYAANDDIYYNRPPIGKPKVKRMKRNNEKDNLNNYQEQNKNTKTSQELKKNEEEVKNNDKSEISNGNDNSSKIKRRNNTNNISTNVGVFPSQLKSIANEREILNLES